MVNSNSIILQYKKKCSLRFLRKRYSEAGFSIIMKKRLNFSNSTKAEIFKRDHAICSFTGRSLWILDYGADPDYEIDWVDHIIPASEGGGNDLGNGALAGWTANYDVKDSIFKKYICREGKLTDKTNLSKKRIQEINSDLKRFSNLVIADWYLNRALWHIWIAGLYDFDIKHGFKRTRNKEYWLGSSKSKMEKWLKLTGKDGFTDLENRGLIPVQPRDDQKELINSIGEIKNLKHQEKFIRLLQDKMNEID